MHYKYLTLTLIANLFTLGILAQPVIESQTTTGGSLKDSLTVIIFTSDGGSIAGGISLSNISGDKTANNKGGRDYWVVKYDSAGTILWDKTIGGSRDDILTCLLQTTDGGYILGGYSLSGKSGDKTQAGFGGNDYWVVKLDNLGNIQWNKTIGGNKDDGLYTLIETDDGGYLLGGNSKSGKSGVKTDTSRAGSYDYWIVKLNNSGKLLWDKTIGGFYYEKLTTVKQVADGGYVLGGYSESGISGEKTENPRGAFDYWLVKIDSTGVVQWDKTMGGDKRDQLTSMELTKDGGYIIAGYSQSRISGEKTADNRGNLNTSDYWIIKLDSLRNIQWDKTIGGNLNDTCTAIIKTQDGGYLVGGYSLSGISSEKTESSRGAYDFWVVKISGTGTIQWDKTVGGSRNDNLMGLYEAKKDLYVLAGFSNSGISADKTTLSKGNYDFWVVKLKYTQLAFTGLNIHADSINFSESKINPEKDFNVYPNPAKNMIYIQTKTRAIITVTN